MNSKNFKQYKNWKRFPAGASSGVETNLCFYDIGTDATAYGFILGTWGTSIPTETEGAVPIYEFTWDSSGLFILSFGTGDTQLTDVTQISITSSLGTQKRIAAWDESETAYEFTDVNLATNMIAEYDTGVRDFCVKMEIAPDKFVSINFIDLQTGAMI